MYTSWCSTDFDSLFRTVGFLHYAPDQTEKVHLTIFPPKCFVLLLSRGWVCLGSCILLGKFQRANISNFQTDCQYSKSKVEQTSQKVSVLFRLASSMWTVCSNLPPRQILWRMGAISHVLKWQDVIWLYAHFSLFLYFLDRQFQGNSCSPSDTKLCPLDIWIYPVEHGLEFCFVSSFLCCLSTIMRVRTDHSS